MTTRLVLLDRDGVLNEDLPTSVRRPEALRLIPGAAAAVARLNCAGVRVAVVTNQSVVGRGLVTPAELDAIHASLAHGLAAAGARLDALYVCSDAPGQHTGRRKPAPGMLLEALADFAADAAATPMVGDALRDLEAAAAAGCPRILVRTGKGTATLADGIPAHVRPVAVHDDLAAAVDALLAGWGGGR